MKPKLSYTLRLLCVYCGKTPLRKSWFVFQKGCPDCNYRYERELGYYTGASQMVIFPAVSLLAFAMAAILIWLYPDLDGLLIAGVVSAVMLFFGAWFTPYGMAIWLYCEHRLHPLNSEDSIDKELVN